MRSSLWILVTAVACAGAIGCSGGATTAPPASKVPNKPGGGVKAGGALEPPPTFEGHGEKMKK
jgi:hypothetical protein